MFCFNFNKILCPRTKIEDFLANDEEEVYLGNFNSFQRLLLHQMVQIDYDDQIFLLNKRGEGRNVTMYAYKGGLEERIKTEEMHIQADIDELQGDCGMSAILNVIKTSV